MMTDAQLIEALTAALVESKRVISVVDEAMRMQELREDGELVLPQQHARLIWNEARSQAREQLKLPDVYPTGMAAMYDRLAEAILRMDLFERLAKAETEISQMKNFLNDNTSFFDTTGPNGGAPVLSTSAARIWYHATDDVTSYPFVDVIKNA